MIVSLEQTITAVAARCMRIETPIHADMPFARLGLDSLGTIELAAALEAELGHDLPADVLAECSNARALATRIARDRTMRAADPFAAMLADAVLPPDVRPLCPVHRATDLRQARTILVTGATGFLGAAVVEELLEQTAATLVCLVRRERCVTPKARIVAVQGDLSLPRLGLDEANYNRLAAEVDAVVHCGAAVNWVFSYAALRAANVTGTTELLRLAARAGAAFHFISSISACYAHGGPPTADESFDGLSRLRQVHLGYAQTKIVGETLVREAAARGLPARIYRPALISGHSVTGAYNRDDLIATLVRGCVAMRTAPDLDWTLDAVPVDVVAKAVVALSRADCSTFHIVHPRPRHWRECVLWMRLYGYDVRLVSYAKWLRQLDAEAQARADHPLRPLRRFFTGRPAGARGLTLPELFEERRRTRAVSATTSAQIVAAGVHVPPLDATLLDTYFAAFIDRDDLPPVSRVFEPATAVGRVFRPGRVVPHLPDLEILSSGSDHSIIGELTAWRSGHAAGLWHARLRSADGDVREVMIKRKATDADVIAVGEAIAEVVDPQIAVPYRRWSRQLGLVASHEREIAIYRQQDPRFLAHAPHVVNSIADEKTRTWLLIQERVTDARLLDSADDGHWTPDDIEVAIDGLASLHSIWFGRTRELRAQPWIGHVHSAASMGEMADLWTALAHHAAPLFSSWADPALATLHRRLAVSARDWWRVLDAGPHTLIHGDFNPRNVCLRGTPARLCAYDWELATLGAPQRDLAEFLCFALSAETAASAPHWVERHRQALFRSTGVLVDGAPWLAGFRAAMCDLLINRLAIYTMVHRIKPQRFLPRVVSTWQQLARITGCEALA